MNDTTDTFPHVILQIHTIVTLQVLRLTPQCLKHLPSYCTCTMQIDKLLTYHEKVSVEQVVIIKSLLIEF